MQPVNAEFRMQNSDTGPASTVVARVCSLSAFCILHSALPRSAPSSSPACPAPWGSPEASSRRTFRRRFKDVTFSQRLGEQLPLDARFTDESGREVALRRLLRRQEARRARVRVLPVPDAVPAGDERDLVGPEGGAVHGRQGLRRRAGQLRSARHARGGQREEAGAPAALGRARDGRRLALSHRDRGRRSGASPPRPASPTSGTKQTQQFAHVSGVLVATPDGRLSRYFYGVEFSPKDLRLALVDSGQGQVGSVVDELLLYCFHYDPSSGRYGAVVHEHHAPGRRADGRSHRWVSLC